MNWRQNAACVGVDPELFFTATYEDRKEALAVCARCPVIDQCRDDALRDLFQYGVRGGMSAQARAVLPRPGRAPCGTRSGYVRHLRRGDQACTPCQEAERAYKRANARSRKERGMIKSRSRAA